MKRLGLTGAALTALITTSGVLPAQAATRARLRSESGFALNDPRTTPGHAVSATRATVCAPGYARSPAKPDAATKAKVFALHGVSNPSSKDYELDRLIPANLGGDRSVKNLWIEPNDHPKGYANSKDKLEAVLHTLVCTGRVPLATARQAITSDWVKAYKRYVGPLPTRRSSSGIWRPAQGAPWQWQLSGSLDTSVDVPTYDIDMFDNSSSTVRSLHAAGRHVICYVDVGTLEPGRPDSSRFPSSLVGKPVDGFEDEHWLDVRALSTLKPILDARIAQCAAKGFDAIEPDNVDGYANDTGFPISSADQLAFNKWVASDAHAHGLGVGLKNDLGQIPDLVGSFDFAVNEQCFEYGECSSLKPFISAGKAVLHVEYTGSTASFCPSTTALHFSSMLKHLELDAYRDPC